MNANELRIGNYVSVNYVSPSGRKKQVIKQSQINAIDGYKMDVDPIPLTEEWLLKFGFTKGTDLWGERAEYEFLFDQGHGITVSDTNEIYMGCFSQTLQYVHQLQNLIYAMSGVELQLSST